jgi:hypothetical protein
MLKLIYHTAVFGPIDLEYEKPVIRVGRNEDNDLVLRHPSVEPYHCLLVFRSERVACLPPSEAVPSEADVRKAARAEFGVGEQLTIGELRFTLAHSSRTVAIPEVHPQEAMGEASPPPQGRYYCSTCRKYYLETEVKRVGLVGHAKRCLCPKCSRVLELYAGGDSSNAEIQGPTAAHGQPSSPGFKERWRQAARKLSVL